MKEKFKAAAEIFGKANASRDKCFYAKSDPALFNQYVSDPDVRSIADDIAEASKFSICRCGKRIYLIPDEDNSSYCFTRSELINALIGSGSMTSEERQIKGSLAQLSVIILLMEYFPSDGEEREFYSQDQFITDISDCLRRCRAENDDDFGMEKIKTVYESLRTDDPNGKSKDTKFAFTGRILNFLSSQDLIEFVDDNHNRFRATEKLTAKMTLFKSDEHAAEISKFFEEKEKGVKKYSDAD